MTAQTTEIAHYIVYLLVFLSVAMLAEVGFVRLRSATTNSHVNRRLGLLAEGKSREEVMSLLRRTRSAKMTSSPLAPLLTWLDRRMSQAGMRIASGKVLGGMIGTTIGVGVLFPLVAELAGKMNSLGAFAILILFAGCIGIGLPLFVINGKANKRIKMFDAQFPVALDIFIRGLRAGHPVSSALELLTTEMADPCGSEFGLVIDETNYRLDPRGALVNLSDRIGTADVQMFVVCVSIQSETGGNLAEILEGLVKVIRERASMVLKVKALSSEGKMTGMMLSILPVFTFTIVFISSPQFYLDVADDPLFMPALVCILGMYLGGILTIKKMTNLKV